MFTNRKEMTSVGDVLCEKKGNLCRFIESLVGSDMTQQLREQMFCIRNMPAQQFAAFILEVVAPHAQDVDVLVEQLCKEWKVDSSRFAADDRAKIRRYFEFFLKVVTGPD